MRIAFTGELNSGKSTAANYLVEKYGFKKFSFAEKLKNNIIKDIIGVPDEYISDRKLKETVIPSLGVSYRELAQKIGTEMFRTEFSRLFPQIKLLDTSIWIHATFKDVDLSPENEENMVVDDCRFENEARFLNKHGFTIIKITEMNPATKAPVNPASFVSKSRLGTAEQFQKAGPNRWVPVDPKDVEAYITSGKHLSEIGCTYDTAIGNLKNDEFFQLIDIELESVSRNKKFKCVWE
jgi:adenylate kinase family enzyme